MSSPRRLTVTDSEAVWTLCTPLGSRLGLLQVRDAEAWERVGAAVPALGERPDMRRGIVIGLMYRAGTPANGRWPARIEGVRSCDGAGIVEASFAGGSYLPDGTGLLEVVYVSGVDRILAVEVDGVIFLADR